MFYVEVQSVFKDILSSSLIDSSLTSKIPAKKLSPKNVFFDITKKNAFFWQSNSMSQTVLLLWRHSLDDNFWKTFPQNLREDIYVIITPPSPYRDRD